MSRNKPIEAASWKKYTCSSHQNVCSFSYPNHRIDLHKKKNPSYSEGCTQKIFLFPRLKNSSTNESPPTLKLQREADIVRRSPRMKNPPTLKLRWAKAETKGFEPLIRFPVYTLSPGITPGLLQPPGQVNQFLIRFSMYFLLFFFFISNSLFIASVLESYVSK